MGIKSFSALVKSQGQPFPTSHALFTPNALNPNFEIAILFKIVQRSNNYASRVDTPPPASRVRAISYSFYPWLT